MSCVSFPDATDEGLVMVDEGRNKTNKKPGIPTNETKQNKHTHAKFSSTLAYLVDPFIDIPRRYYISSLRPFDCHRSAVLVRCSVLALQFVMPTKMSTTQTDAKAKHRADFDGSALVFRCSFDIRCLLVTTTVLFLLWDFSKVHTRLVCGSPVGFSV